MRMDTTAAPDGDTAAAGAVFTAAHTAFERAAHASGGAVDFFCTVAGHPIRLRFAGPTLVPFLTRALSHLATPACPTPALTVGVWAGGSRAERPALPAWWWDAWTGQGEAHVCHDGRIHTAVHAATLSMLDAALDRGLYFADDPADLTCTERGSPLLRILHWWMRDRGLQLIHGGAIGTDRGGVLLAGRGGSGKSTISLLALASDLRYAADDYCLVSSSPSPQVHTLYCSGKVHAADVDRFAFLRPALSNADRLGTEKALYLLHEAFPHRLSKGFPLRAVIVPRITGGRRTTLTRVTSAAALLALAPSTIFQLPGAGRDALRTLASVVSRVPSYGLDVGTDFARIPQVISDLLANP